MNKNNEICSNKNSSLKVDCSCEALYKILEKIPGKFLIQLAQLK